MKTVLKNVFTYLGKTVLNIVLSILLMELVQRAIDRILPWND